MKSDSARQIDGSHRHPADKKSIADLTRFVNVLAISARLILKVVETFQFLCYISQGNDQTLWLFLFFIQPIPG